METNELFVRASSIEPKDINWLWYPYIPLGKVTILQGDPGDGKSTLMLNIAAMLTKGEALPFTDPNGAYVPMTVIYQTTEDDADDTVVPRFMKADGNRENLIFIREDKIPLTFEDERIPVVLKETGAKLLILDPFSSYIGDCSVNAANEIRPRFNHLVLAAKENGCAIVIIDHLNKMQGLKTLYRNSGSVDKVGAARSVLTVIRDEDDPDKRYMVQTKANLAPLGSAIVFSVSDDGLEFLEEIEATADDLMSASSHVMGRPDDRVQEAMVLISEMLEDGELPAVECMRRLKESGIGAGTAKKAKKLLGVKSRKANPEWLWLKPDSGQEVNNHWVSEDAQVIMDD